MKQQCYGNRMSFILKKAKKNIVKRISDNFVSQERDIIINN